MFYAKLISSFLIMAMVGNLYIDLRGYFTLLFIMAKVGKFLENEI
jgi:hypothetical protein